MARRSTPITLSPDEREALEGLVRRPSTAQQLARRAQMILLAADGVGVGETARRLGLWRKGVSVWRARWAAEIGKGSRQGDTIGRRRTAVRCPALGGAADHHGGADLRPHRPGLRTTGGRRCSDEPLERRRLGARGSTARPRPRDLAPLRGAPFKKKRLSSRIASDLG